MRIIKAPQGKATGYCQNSLYSSIRATEPRSIEPILAPRPSARRSRPLARRSRLGNVKALLSHFSRSTSLIKGRVFVYFAFPVIFSILFSVGLNSANAQIGGGVPTFTKLYGAAWSSNIGWISFNSCEVDLSEGAEDCPPGVSYSVQVNNETGLMTGAAWSPNVGWLQFGGLSGFPDGGGTEPTNAKTVLSQGASFGKVEGWARFLAGTDDPDDGWDGWVSMSGTNYPSPQSNGNGGVTYNAELGKLLGAAWGGPVVGWIYFGDTTGDWPNVWYGLPDAVPDEFDYSLDSSSPNYEISIPAGGSGDVTVSIDLESGEPESVELSYPVNPNDGISVSKVGGDENPCVPMENDSCEIILRISVGGDVEEGEYEFIVSGTPLDKNTTVRFSVPSPQPPPPVVNCSAEGGIAGGKFFFLDETPVNWSASISITGEGEPEEPEYVWRSDGIVVADCDDDDECELSYTTVGPKLTEISIDGGLEFYQCDPIFIIPRSIFFIEI